MRATQATIPCPNFGNERARRRPERAASPLYGRDGATAGEAARGRGGAVEDLLGVEGGPDEHAGVHGGETEGARFFRPALEVGGRHVARDGAWSRVGRRYWPRVTMSTPAARRSASTARISASVSPRPSMRPLLVTWPGRRARARRARRGCGVVALRAQRGNSRGAISTLWLNTSGRAAATARGRAVALEVGREHLDPGPGRRSRTARTVAANWPAPPSARSSRATAVSTT